MSVTPDLVSCDKEPIHIPGAIQPHGLLLIASAQTLEVVGGAGAIESRLAREWKGAALDAVLGQDVRSQIARLPSGVQSVALKEPVRGLDECFDALVHCAGNQILVELEPAPDDPMRAVVLLSDLDRIRREFEEAEDLRDLCHRTAVAVRSITGFERVMVYRFHDDASGHVFAEDCDPSTSGFLHHHFPASDIPRQARALYVRNRARAIPDVEYVPAPLQPVELSDVDLSDVGLRSVSRVHLEYLRNMGVRASASFSIVRDDTLWGLIACHSAKPLYLTRETMMAATAVAGALSREVVAREEQAAYALRLRLRGEVDELLVAFRGDRPLLETVGDMAERLRRLLDADGFVYVDGDTVHLWGAGPQLEALRPLAAWAAQQARSAPFATRRLSEHYPQAADWPNKTSGLLALTLSHERQALLWLRVEQVEEVRWAGDPSKLHEASPDLPLRPRRSFETWVQSVQGLARPWGQEAIDGGRRLARGIDDALFHRRLRLLNRELQATVEERDALLAQQELLMREVDHRVQNSLQMVSSYLMLQAREVGPGEVADRLAEAQARLAAVGLVHRRLYRADHPQTIDLGDYLGELVTDLRTALGGEWSTMLRAQLGAMLVTTDRAVAVGLIMTELVINASKYAYEGVPGPIEIKLAKLGERFRLTVADRGRGASKDAPSKGSGFGRRMLAGTVQRLKGTLEQVDNAPGLRVIVTAQIDA